MKAFERSLILCDVENLSEVPPPLGTQGDYECGLRMLADLAQVELTDHVVVASHPNPKDAFAARSVFPGCLVQIGHGPDGADNMLLEHLHDPDWVAARYGRVVIGSGDGAFADALKALGAAGVPTVVVSRRRRCSWRLRINAGSLVWWPEPSTVADPGPRRPFHSESPAGEGRYSAGHGDGRLAC